MSAPQPPTDHEAPESAMNATQNASNRRAKKLIEPRIQMRFALIFLTTAALAVLVQALVVSYLMMATADSLPNDGALLKSRVLDVLASGLGVTMLMLVPLTLLVGITSTHKVVGPLYRFRVYLTQLAAGERPAPCRIRQNDEQQDLCELLNRATQPLRETKLAALPREEVA
jgi:nitrogen fixation/metabolism regulation signal transduction histidine kinase